MMNRKIFNRLVSGYRILNEPEEEKFTNSSKIIISPQEVDMNSADGKKKTTDLMDSRIEQVEISEFKIPEFKPSKVRIGKEDSQDIRLRPMIYPLIPLKPKRGW